MLLDPAAITRVLEFLKPEDFYRENNSQIYRAAIALFQAGEPIDNVTLAASLERIGVLERVGGRAQLALLAEGVPTAANVEYYARIVRSKAIKRKLIQAGGEVAAVGFDEAVDADDALNRAEKAVFDVAEERVSSALSKLYELLRPAMDRIDAQMSSGNAVVGVPSGFYDLDNLTSGFKPSDLIVVAGRPAMGKCLTANTLIDDPRSGARMTIREFVRRRLPLVWGISSEGFIRPTRVGDWVDSGVQDAFRVRTWTGRTVEVTGHHPFLTTDGWQPLHDLGVGDSIAVPRQVPCFGSDDSAGHERIQALARHLSQGRRRARLPSECWRWSRARLLELVGTLFGESGSELRVASPGLAADLQHALTRFGIVSTIWAGRAGSWTIRITDRGTVAAPAPSSLATVGGGQEGTLASREIQTAAYAYLLDETQTRRLASPDLLWDEIVEVQPVGRQQVYDLTVPDGSNFIAQDVVVHNTSFMLNLTLHAAIERQVPVAVFSLEMSKEQLVERLLCQQARIDSQRMHRGMLSEAEYERLVMAIGPLENAPIFIDDSPVLDELSLLLKARQARLRENIGMVVLDYLQLMQGRGGRGDDFNRVQEVSSISRSLKALARELKIPVIAISQLSRAPEARPNKRPMLSDLRESGSIEQDSDIVMFLYRDDYYNPSTDQLGIAEVHVAKHRNGPTDTIKLRYRKDQTLFYNLESRRPEPEPV
jgi:replicative DNA helicase